MEFHRPRFVKINKKESPNSTPNVHEKQVSSDVSLRYKPKEKIRTKTDASEEKISGWRLNKVRYVILISV